MTEINDLVQAASDSLFAPESLNDIRCRLSFIEASECNCGVSPHENAIHDLIGDDVPVLLRVIEQQDAALKAAWAEVERLRAGLYDAWDEGNCCGLDGWIGPGRDMDIDEEALRCRRRDVDRILNAGARP